MSVHKASFRDQFLARFRCRCLSRGSSRGDAYGINKKTNVYGAMSGMIVGIIFTAGYIIWFKFMNPPEYNVPANWWFGISPEGIGTLGMIFNFVIMYVVSKLTPEPPQEVQYLVESLRFPGKNVPKASSH